MFTHERLKYNMLKSVTKQAHNRGAQSLGLVRIIIIFQNINDTVFNLSRNYEQVEMLVYIVMHAFKYRWTTILINCNYLKMHIL